MKAAKKYARTFTEKSKNPYWWPRPEELDSTLYDNAVNDLIVYDDKRIMRKLRRIHDTKTVR